MVSAEQFSLTNFLRFYLFVQIADLANEDTPQLYVACGRGPRSSLRVLRHGLEVRGGCDRVVLVTIYLN